MLQYLPRKRVPVEGITAGCFFYLEIVVFKQPKMSVGEMQLKKPRISVIIITYNQEKYLSQAIESVLLQKTEFSYELIISDDCSSDTTPEIIQLYADKHDHIIPLLNDENCGASANYMQAVKYARGEYVVVFEGDDYWIDENKLQIQAEFLDTNPEYFGVSHLLEMKDDNNASYGTTPNDRRMIDKDVSPKLFAKGITFSCMATMYRNLFLHEDAYGKYYQYITTHRMVADLALCLVFMAEGKVFILDKAMSVYRVSSPTAKNSSSYNTQTNEEKKLKDAVEVIRVSEQFWGCQYKLDGLLYNHLWFYCFNCIIHKDLSKLRRGLSVLHWWQRLHFFCFFIVKGIKLAANKLKRLRQNRIIEV